MLSRRRKGSEISLGRGMKRVPTEKEEALTLSGVDLDDMACKYQRRPPEGFLCNNCVYEGNKWMLLINFLFDILSTILI